MKIYTNIVDFFYCRCTEYSDNIFIKNSNGISYTYNDIKTTALKTFNFLRKYEIKTDDKISIILPNVPEYIPLLIGIFSYGGIAVNLNINFTPDEFKIRLSDADVSMVILTPELYHKIKDVLNELSIQKILIVSNDTNREESVYNMDIIQKENSSLEVIIPDYNLSKIAFLQYTGGTTGGIKAAMLSHGNILSNVTQIRKHFGKKLTESAEVMPATFPLYHVFALTFNIFSFFNIGATCLMYPVTKDLPLLIKILKENKITCFVGVNTLYKLLMQSSQLTKNDFPKLKICIGGGEHIQLNTKIEWEKLSGVPIYEAYGMTETSAMAIVNPLNEYNDPETIGIPIPDTQVQLLDEHNQVITNDNEHGEIVLKGPQVITRYWNKPAENETSFINGWLRTGDIAVRKNGTYFKIVDRKKDMISVSGFKVFPNEVEAVITSFGGINDCAVIGERDDQTGERVVLYYVAKDIIDQQALTEYSKKYLTAFKIPKKIYKVELIPKTAIGKTMRSSLRKLQESN